MLTNRVKQARGGFTLVELLVVMAIIAVLIGLLVPAVQKVRDAASRTTCQNNLKQLGLAVLNYESSFKSLPTPGEGIDPGTGTKYYTKQSFFTVMLPYVEQAGAAKAFDQTKFYNDPLNKAAAQTQVPVFLCPAADGLEPDPAGYGQTSYMPFAYTDINETTGLRDPIKISSALRIFSSDFIYTKAGAAQSVASGTGFEHFKTNAGTIAKVIDGTSNTIIVGEDATWRNHRSIFPFQSSTASDPAAVAGIIAAADNESDGQGFRAINRWAEPENGNGVSGPPLADPASAKYWGGSAYNPGGYPGPWVNQNQSPLGGDASNVAGPGNTKCSWADNNCGPNDELNSAHAGGCNVLFLDGHVQFLRETVSGKTLRRMIVPDDGNPVDMLDAF